MNLWTFLDGLIRQPPSVLVAILIALLVSHALKIALEFVTQRSQPNALIISLEIIVVIVLSYLAVHLYVGRHVNIGEPTRWYTEPFWMTLLLVLFTFASTVLYILFRAAIQDQSQQ